MLRLNNLRLNNLQLNHLFIRRIASRIPTHAKRIYIIPTSVGVYFGIVTFAMLFIGAGYNNNLVNMLAFFMFALVFVSMVITQAQLQGLEIKDAEAIDSFAGEPVEVSVLVSNSTTTEKFGMEWKWQSLAGIDQGSGIKTVRARPGGRISWTFTVSTRGKYTFDQLVMSSVFPLGLFYSWKKLRLPLTFWVYPKPEGDLPVEVEESGNRVQDEEAPEKGKPESWLESGGEDFRGHRRYQVGDSSRRVDWKAFARTDTMLVKELSVPDRPELDLSWSRLPEHWSAEAKLSQLSRWIQLALDDDRSFVLSLPQQAPWRGRGHEAAQKGLRALAEFNVTEWAR